MNKPNADTELIRKYFNGELSPAAQYELEKRALDDPFLQDSMDGFEQFSVEQKSFDDLNNRLANRVQKKEKIVAIWGFKQWSIAASLIFGIAAISIYSNQTPENKVIAVSELQKIERLPKSVRILEDTLKENVPNVLEESINNAQSNTSASEETKPFSIAEELTLLPSRQTNALAANDTLALNEVSVIGYGTQKKADLTGSISRFKAEELAKLNTESATSVRISNVSASRSKNLNAEQIIGKVISSENGEILPGVQIKNTQNSSTSSTNENGEFKIQASEKDELTIQYMGFITQTVVIAKNKYVKISLKKEPQILPRETINIQSSSQKATQNFAGPKGGWKEFRKYLDENAKLKTGETGRVVVQFYIQPDGKLSDFLIQKSYNNLANNKAILLIKNYGVWYGSANGKAQKAKVTVRFK